MLRLATVRHTRRQRGAAQHIYSVFGSSASGVGKMPPKRNAAQLRALAEDPVGWLQTPVAKRTEIGIAGDYLSAFLMHHVMPVTRRDVNNASGPRLCQSMKKLVPVVPRALRAPRAASKKGYLRWHVASRAASYPVSGSTICCHI